MGPVVAVASNLAALEARRAAARVSRPVSPPDDHENREARDAAMADWLEHRVELVVRGLYALLSHSFLARFPDRVVNVHPAPCPNSRCASAGRPTRGRRPAAAATVHYVDEGVDTGAVIAPIRACPPRRHGRDAARAPRGRASTP
jgi:phosphoribosylglycinamide formyltransferase-1